MKRHTVSPDGISPNDFRIHHTSTHEVQETIVPVYFAYIDNADDKKKVKSYSRMVSQQEARVIYEASIRGKE